MDHDIKLLWGRNDLAMFKRIKILLDMIKFEHTVFALPFAYLGAFLAAQGLPPLRESLLILLGMVGGRTAAMGFNRIVDLPFDAKNPRTKDRPLVTGAVKDKEAWAMVIISGAIFFLAAYLLNPLAFKLSPWVFFVLLAYSYTKRFTPLCHIFLGFAIGIAPTAGWIAVKGSVSTVPILISIGVLFWVAGFDILYACLDTEFDKREGLHSIPSAIGVRRAFFVSAAFHAVAFFTFLLVGIMAHLGLAYYIGLVGVSALFILQRRVVSPEDLSRMNLAFFTLNGLVSLILFCFTAIDLLIF